MTLEFDGFYLIGGYVPNSGDGLRRLVVESFLFCSCCYLNILQLHSSSCKDLI